ncbi:MAG TPA: hypothetical protein VFJ96_04475 [Gemmatimonadaceae bacterium]|nr:hypothetical protein [Gemmatimonadaceae bacterium]
MAATSKTKRRAGAKSTKKSSRTATKAKRSRSTTSRASTRTSSSRATATKTRSATQTARKSPARKRSARTTTKTAAKKRAPAVSATNINAQDRKFLEQHANELSESTLHARWIHSPDEHEDRAGQTLATRDHEVIRHWADERHATPAAVPGTEHGDNAGVLRFNFPGYGGSTLAQISWDQWFAPFDDRALVFVFQEHKADGSQSNFFHLDSPSREHS